MEHTPGPWRHGAKNVYAGKEVIAQCWDWTLYNPIPHELPAQANACFIAAAPDLLAACEAFIMAMDNSPAPWEEETAGVEEAYNMALKAIAAARPVTEPTHQPANWKGEK